MSGGKSTFDEVLWLELPSLNMTGILSLEIRFSAVDEIRFAGGIRSNLILHLIILSDIWLNSFSGPNFLWNDFVLGEDIPLKFWKLCQDGPEFFIVHLHREVTAWVSRFLEGHTEPFMKIYEQHMESIIVREEDYPEFQRYIFAQNKVIPKEIWPREGIQPDVRQDDEIYHERIKSARNQYYYELNQAQKGEDIWSQDPWNFDDIDAVLEEVEKIEKAYAQKSRKKRPEDKSQWNKDVWRTKRRQSGMDRQEWVNYMGYPSYSSYSTESDTASDEDSVMDLQFRGEWMIMKANQPEWNPQNWKGKRFMNEG
nr:hypothetical protein Iba_chr14dCG1200 [Ipomoea batatas]